jgi:hypothetical protein
MDPRTTTSGTSAQTADSAGRSRRGPHRRPPAGPRRPALFLAVAAAGAVLVNVLVGAEPAARAGATASEPVSVAEQLGMTTGAGQTSDAQDLRLLEQLSASRSSREAAQVAAQQAQAAADQVELDRRQAEEAAAKAAAEKAAADQAAAEKAAAEKAAADQAAAEKAAAEQVAAAAKPAAPAAPAARATAASTAASVAGAIARITNSAGAVKPQAQAAANQVVSNVPGAAGITIGGTRASATDPNGHPSGRALDYMVLTDEALGDAIAQYQIDHWAELGVEYVIWQQRMLSSPTGSWKMMEDRGSVTENHYDHVHVNYR